jgi:oxaloacetate decarboxylase alpha subunit
MVKITDTTLRDGQQSLIATRMTTEQMLPVLGKMDKAGFHSLEMWGGATFDACLRFLNEDPWERLRRIRAACPKTKLQMLLRGQNILGYKHYPDDIVEYFIQRAIANGIDIIRAFDALNDPRNLETSVKTIKKEKAHAQLCISYTLSKVHTIEYYIKYVKQLESMGADSICVKDMAGLLLPQAAYDLVKAIKETTKLPLQIHTHYGSGTASMSYMKAIEAGADIIDTAMSPFALGSSQPATEVMAAVLEGTPYATGLKPELLREICAYFAPLRAAALESGLLDTKVLGADIDGLTYQVPGGMLSNLVSQLKQQGSSDKFNAVLAEIPRVREDLGFPPLVTPTSQIVGTQAVMNVLAGERYKMVPKETKELARGMYGRTPVKISDKVRTKLIGNDKPRDARPADSVPPGLAAARAEAAPYMEQEEDALSYALFPQVAMDFFKFRHTKKYGVDLALANNEEPVYPA